MTASLERVAMVLSGIFLVTQDSASLPQRDGILSYRLAKS
jgi:hypothetical protein